MSTSGVQDATDADWPGIALLTAVSFSSFWRPETIAAWRTLMPERSSVIVRDGDDVVGMAHYLDLEMTVPGGATLPTAGVTWVGVAPTHRRRGLLRAMFAELHQRISDAGYPIASLTASEGGIYGRFGYGPATVETQLGIDRRFATWHRDAPDPRGVRVVRAERSPRRVRGDLRAVPAAYAGWLAAAVAAVGRPAGRLGLLARRRHPVVRAAASRRLRALPDAREPARRVGVEEFTAVTPDAHVALWRALLGLDLVETITAPSHPDESLPYLLDDSRVVRTTASQDDLWLRIMDVVTALEARTYRGDLRTVLEITDEFRSDGGRFALDVSGGRARCTRTAADAEFTMDLDVLGSLYLGAHRAADLAAANRIRGGTPARLGLLDIAFGSDVPARLGFGF